MNVSGSMNTGRKLHLFVRPVHELRNQHSALGRFGRVVSAHFWVGRFGLRRWVVLVNFCEELFRPLTEVNEKKRYYKGTDMRMQTISLVSN